MATASREAIKAGEAVVELSLDDRKFNSSLAGMKNKFRQVASSMRELITLSAGITVAMVPVISAFVRFDDAMLAVRAVSESTAKEMDLLKAKARSAGVEIGYTASEVGRLMVELSKSGFKGTALEQITSDILNLARASETELKVATEIYLDTFKQFQLTTADSTRLADALAKAANASSVSVTDLGFSLKYAAPVAKDLGMSLEDTLAILAMYGDVGIKGEMAGTTLRRMMTVVSAGGKEIKAIFGVQVADALGKVRPLVDIMGDIGDATRGMSQEMRIQKFKQFFDLLGITGATILSERTTDVRRLRGELNDLNNYAERTAKMMNSGVGGGLRRVGAALENLAISIGDALIPALTGLGTALMWITEFFTGWIERNKLLASSIGVVAVAIISLTAAGLGLYVVALGFKGIATAATAAAGTIKLVGLALKALFITSPIGWIALFAAALATVWYKFSERGKRVIDGIAAAFVRIGNIIAEMFGGIVAAFQKGNLELAMDIALAGMHAAWLEFVIMLRGSWYDFTNFFSDAMDDAIISIAKGLTNLVATIRTAFLDMFLGIVDQANKVAAAVNELLSGKKRDFRVEFINSPEGQKIDAEIQRHRAAIGTQDAHRNKQLAELENPNLTPQEQIKLLDAANAAADAINQHTIEIQRLMEKERQGTAKLAAGDNWIDPSRFQADRDRIAKDAAQFVKELDKVNEEEKRARRAGQNDRLDGIRQERERILAEMRKLIEQANKVEDEAKKEVPNGLPFGSPALEQTPMLPPEMQPAFTRYADSAKGLYQSADFRQSLGIGGPNKVAQDAYTELKNIHGTLKNIEAKVGNNNFD